ncbi:outer membrane lipid asymmetry maintenance protein MlaD [Hahella sp. CCB-MM4]|uniref:outer membrane lipid asymmetry maintenance protein MlaD n=1 Tax=Hahella sp. (strain CCB-MM4) TaxID=1926491 RepID=UPI000B9B0FC6|nr:outer membrane lipid asymmetry maintenance protein MlaD [Hahella sp. CCB-MM4]OZG70536.1 outer membrane lipid asymmetry maintenance protein MlaD [Hahella sp. CCB-MM4]
MRLRTMEISVGLFIMAGIAALFLLALEVSGLSLRPTEKTYKLYAEFNDVGGLRVRGKVSLAGVTIGRVSNIYLDGRSIKAVVEMDIDANVDYLSKDSIAVVSTAGLLGEKYINVSIGGDEDALEPGDFFDSTQSALNLEKLISDFATSKL